MEKQNYLNSNPDPEGKPFVSLEKKFDQMIDSKFKEMTRDKSRFLLLISEHAKGREDLIRESHRVKLKEFSNSLDRVGRLSFFGLLFLQVYFRRQFYKNLMYRLTEIEGPFLKSLKFGLFSMFGSTIATFMLFRAQSTKVEEIANHYDFNDNIYKEFFAELIKPK